MCVERRQAGYTLVELMIVVTIVMLVMAAAGPAFGNAFADRRAATATQDVQRIGRQAFWETVSYRRAHVVHFTGMAGATAGRVELIRGHTNTCAQDWQWLRDRADCGNRNSRCIDWVDLGSSEYNSADRGPRLRESNANGEVAICYQPDGTTAHAGSLDGPFVETNQDAGGNSLGGGYVFTVRSFDDGTAEGVVRSLLYPLGGMARRLR